MYICNTIKSKPNTMKLTNEFIQAINRDFSIGQTAMGLIISVEILSESSIAVKFLNDSHDYGFIYCSINKFFLQVN